MCADFQFKQFTVRQDRCTMKVGTDAVLLGAWAKIPPQKPIEVLDIGTGTGILALMIAQRLSATFRITAIDIEPHAATQAQENFDASPCKGNLLAKNIALNDYPSDFFFQLIVANPPFFEASLPSHDDTKNLARNAVSMPPEQLMRRAAELLAHNGFFNLIIPYERLNSTLSLAATHLLQPIFLTKVFFREKTPQRALLCLAKEHNPLITNELHIFSQDNYSEEYQRLTQDFYL